MDAELVRGSASLALVFVACEHFDGSIGVSPGRRSAFDGASEGSNALRGEYASHRIAPLRHEMQRNVNKLGTPYAPHLFAIKGNTKAG